MAWTAPKTFISGAKLLFSELNTHVRDNLRYLKGLDGDVQLSDDLDLQNNLLKNIGAAGAQGQVLYHNGTGFTSLAPGDSGKYLKTQGAGANPLWDNPSPGNIYDTYSNFPAAASNSGALAFATDRQQLYRSNGSDWVAQAPALNYAETIAGVKTFSSIPVLPASDPSTDNQAVRKAYADTMGSFYTVSDTLQSSVDAVAGTTRGTYNLARTIQGGAGNLRIKFDLAGNTATTGYGRIYRKRAGVSTAIGTERPVAGTSYTTYSEDITGWMPGDAIELWYKSSDGVNQISVRNFRVYGTPGAVIWVAA